MTEEQSQAAAKPSELNAWLGALSDSELADVYAKASQEQIERKRLFLKSGGGVDEGMCLHCLGTGIAPNATKGEL